MLRVGNCFYTIFIEKKERIFVGSDCPATETVAVVWLRVIYIRMILSPGHVLSLYLVHPAGDWSGNCPCATMPSVSAEADVSRNTPSTGTYEADSTQILKHSACQYFVS